MNALVLCSQRAFSIFFSCCCMMGVIDGMRRGGRISTVFTGRAFFISFLLVDHTSWRWLEMGRCEGC